MPRGIERPSPELPGHVRRLLAQQGHTSPRVRAIPMTLGHKYSPALRYLLISSGAALLFVLLALGLRHS